MKLNKRRLVLLLKEEYNARLSYFLNEKVNPEYILDPESKGLKITHDESGLVYTFYGYTKDGKSVVMYNPDHARAGTKNPVRAEKVLTDYKFADNASFEPEYAEAEYFHEADIVDADGEIEDNEERQQEPVKGDNLPPNNVDYIVVDIEKFKNEYTVI